MLGEGDWITKRKLKKNRFITRIRGVEPRAVERSDTSAKWESTMLPLHHTRFRRRWFPINLLEAYCGLLTYNPCCYQSTSGVQWTTRAAEQTLAVCSLIRHIFHFASQQGSEMDRESDLKSLPRSVMFREQLHLILHFRWFHLLLSGWLRPSLV